MATVDSLTCVDATSVELNVGARLDIRHARWLRGAIARQIDRPEFHQHCGKALVYRHPQIRYDTSTGDAALRGLKEGAMLLKAFQPPNVIRLGSEDFRVLEHRMLVSRCEVGVVPEPIRYSFVSPYFPLNQENVLRWNRSDSAEQQRMMDRIICGNILSFCKSVGHHVRERIVIESSTRATTMFTLKPGVGLLGFTGSFLANFQLPERWGIGKSSSRGFGTVMREVNADGNENQT